MISSLLAPSAGAGPKKGYVICQVIASSWTVEPINCIPHGKLLGSAARDQTVQVFDICFMKQWVSLRGHKKDVFCVSLLFFPGQDLMSLPTNSPSMALCVPDPDLRWLRRCDSPLGPLLPDSTPTPTAFNFAESHATSTNTATLSVPARQMPCARDTFPSARLKCLGPDA